MDGASFGCGFKRRYARVLTTVNDFMWWDTLFVENTVVLNSYSPG